MYSCVHDEITSLSDASSKEYTNKSLWKEDEKYIKNVMKVYLENESKIKKVNGTPLWDYAMTMGRTDESFLMVPVVEKGKVVAVLNVPRNGQRVYFTYTQVQNDIEFFQNLTSTRIKKAGNTLTDNVSAKIVCTTRTISVWIPDDEGNYNGSGHWDSRNVTECKRQDLENCVGEVLPDGTCLGGGGGDPGYPYPGGGDNPETPVESPCEKLKVQIATQVFKDNMKTLEGKTGEKKETGYSQRANGNYTYHTNASTNENSNTLSLPRADLLENKDIIGYMHTHVDDLTYTDSDGNEVTRTGIKMFSPADVGYLMDMLANAQAAGRPLTDVYGVMVTSNGTYQIRFTGNKYQIKSFTKGQINAFKESYMKAMENSSNLEATFLNFLSEKMNVKATNLYKMNVNANGDTAEITLNNDKKTTSASNCP